MDTTNTTNTTNITTPGGYPPTFERLCTWCAAPITVTRRPGRPRLYCNHTCRQRAYEHRHGFHHERTVLPLPGQHRGDRSSGSGYERGVVPSLAPKSHALRTSVRPEGRRRETLCGVLARPVPGRYFDPNWPRACLTCLRVAERNRLTYGISPSNELSRLRSLIVEGLEHRHNPPEAIVQWLATQNDLVDTTPHAQCRR